MKIPGSIIIDAESMDNKALLVVLITIPPTNKESRIKINPPKNIEESKPKYSEETYLMLSVTPEAVAVAKILSCKGML